MERTNCFDIYLVEDLKGQSRAVRAPYLAGREGMLVWFEGEKKPEIGIIRKRIPSYKNDALTEIFFSVSKVCDAYMIFEPSWVMEEAAI